MSRINSLLINGADESIGDVYRPLPTMGGEPLKKAPHVLTGKHICTWGHVDEAILSLMEELCPD